MGFALFLLLPLSLPLSSHSPVEEPREAAHLVALLITNEQVRWWWVLEEEEERARRARER